MKKVMMVAIAVVAILIIAGTFVALNMDSLFKDGDNNDGTASDAATSVNTTLAVNFSTAVAPGDQMVSLTLSYPGMGQQNFTYNWSEAYRFNLSSAPLNGYQGNVLFKMFAERETEIGQDDLRVTTASGKMVNWTFSVRSGAYDLYNVISGDVGSYKSNGTANGVRAFDVVFNNILNYTLTFQAFDLDSGKAISAPLVISPLNVPLAGRLTCISPLGGGEWNSTENGTYYVVLVNITNNWNARYTVNAAYLRLSNTSSSVVANLSAMSFNSQSLAIGQSTQFRAFFDITGDRTTFALQYLDARSGQVIDIPLRR